MSKKPALGKGLSALLENGDTDIMMSKGTALSEPNDSIGSVSELKVEDI
ncbi:MAG: chromosome partitioning protein ParB, partial [Flavobacteriales bacterium]|nr:chromosome partitioning protein ParB [Flavobacteriales bacterium]